MSRRPPSLTWRIARRLTVIVLITAMIAYGLLFWQVWSAADRMDGNDVYGEAAMLAARVGVLDGTVTVGQPAEFADARDEATGILRYAVTDADGTIVAASPWPTAPQSVSDANRYLAHHGAPASHKYFGAVIRKVLAEHVVTVQVERQGDDPALLVESVVDEFFEHGTWVLAVLLAALLAISIVATRDAMSALFVLSRNASALRPDSPGLRLSEDGVPREALSLVRAVNIALSRLDTALAQQRDFTANAAHELRTPLSVLRAQVDTLADVKAAAGLRQDIEQMTRVIDRLLKMAQLDSSVIGPREVADLKTAATTVASLLIPVALAEDKSIEVVLPAAGGLIHGNLDIVVLALRNVVENAIRYAPAGSCVEIVVGADGSIKVVDRGPGIPAAVRNKVFVRFWRADRTGAGTGLELAIVAKVMALHGGRADVAETPDGGTTVSLVFRAVVPRSEGTANAVTVASS